MFKIFGILFATVIVISAQYPQHGYLDGAYALGGHHENIYRGYGGLSSVSNQVKGVDSPYASIRKTDIRVTNDAGYVHSHNVYGDAPVSYSHGYGGYHAATAIPAYGHSGHAAQYPIAGLTYGHGAIPAHFGHRGGYAAPIGHPRYHAGVYGSPVASHLSGAYHAGAFGSPVASHLAGAYHAGSYAASPIIAKHDVGVGYSPATVVASHNFNGHGVSYGYAG